MAPVSVSFFAGSVSVFGIIISGNTTFFSCDFFSIVPVTFSGPKRERRALSLSDAASFAVVGTVNVYERS